MIDSIIEGIEGYDRRMGQNDDSGYHCNSLSFDFIKRESDIKTISPPKSRHPLQTDMTINSYQVQFKNCRIIPAQRLFIILWLPNSPMLPTIIHKM